MSRMEKFHNQSNKKEKKQEQVKTVQPINTSTPVNKEKKKVRHRGSLAGSFAKVLLLLVILIAAFVFYEYNKGLRTAKADKAFEQVKVEEFAGQKSGDGSINILLLGSDSRGEDQGRSDSILIAHYNKKDKKPKLISFMRDTYANIPGYGYNKINASYSYGGPELVRQTLKETFNVDVQYYAIVNFGSFPKIIDTLAPKGIEIDAEKDLDVDGVYVKKGNQFMTGDVALQYARFRMDEEGDFGRVRRQQQVMNALFTQGTSMKNVFNLPEAIGKVQGYTSTNIPASIYPSVAKDFIFGLSKPMEKLAIPIEGSWSNKDNVEAGSYLDVDEEVNSQAIANFLGTN